MADKPDAAFAGVPGLQQPPNFDFSDPSAWSTWIEQFEDYAYATGMHRATDEVRVRTLLYCMGVQARRVLASFNLTAEEALSYSVVKSKFTSYFVHPLNEVHESYRFHKRTQQADESVDAFYSALRNMVKRCNYGSASVEDRLVRDRFIVGLFDSRLSEQLCRTSDLTLDKALLHARLHEDAEREKRERANQLSGPVAVDAAKHKPVKRQSHKRTSASRETPFSDATHGSCHFCGREKHQREFCPAKKAVCNFCKKKGHFEAVCLAKQRSHSRQSHAIEMHAVKTSREANAKFVWVHVNGVPLKFKVDSGAEVTVVPSTFPGVPSQLEKPEGRLTGPGNYPLNVSGQFRATLEWKSRTCVQPVYVMPSQSTPLLGYPAILALGVVKFVDAAQRPEKPASSSSDATLSQDIFDGLGTVGEEYTIRLKPNAKPFALSVPRRIPIPLYDQVKQELDQMEKQGVIRRITKPTLWCAGLVAVPKASGGIRICVDLTKLNKEVLRERHVLPTVEWVLGQLGDAKVFSKLDATAGFHQVRLSQECQEYTTFITPFGRYCYCRLPFGLTSAPEYFQREMARILEGQPNVVNMIDDILVFGEDREEHDKRLVEVLERLRRAGIKLNKSKCCFGQDKVEFLGVIIDANGISPSPSKLEALRNLEPPKDVAGVRRFLGMVNHIGRFLPNLSQATAPIRALLGEQNAWQWGPLQETAFNRVKEMLTSDLCIAKYHPGRNTIVSCDASSFGLGTVLLQEQPSGERRAVAFASRSLTDAEQRYSQTEKEALAVAWAVHRFDQYVRGLNFTVETDHQPLVTLLGNADLDTMPPRIQRFRIKLMRYQFNVVYVPGKQLATADTLSRAPDEKPSISLVDVVEEFVEFQVAAITDTKLVTADDVRRHQEQDGECNQLVKYCTQGWPRRDRLPEHMKKYWNHRGDLSLCNSVLLKGNRFVIPTSLQKDTLELIHEGHQGINRCRLRAQDSVWWYGLSQQIRDRVSRCRQCAATRAQRSEPLVVTKTPAQPWQEVGMDLFSHRGHNYLLVVDYRSRYPEVIYMRSTTSEAVINAVKSTFARFGIPEVVRSDNGPQFASHAFAAFAKHYGFQHITSSPNYPQSNGQVERTVRTVKELFEKAEDPFLALLSYRDTAGVTGFSPAQLLMGRSLRTRLPKPADCLEPKWPAPDVVKCQDEEVRRRQKKDFDRRRAATVLPPLEPGDTVWVRDIKETACVLSPASKPRSYVVETPTAVLVRNRVHLVPYSDPTTSQLNEPASRENSEGHEDQATVTDATATATPQVSNECGVRVTRFGRRVKTPKRLDL